VPSGQHDSGGDERSPVAASPLRQPSPSGERSAVEVFLGIVRSTALPSVGTRTLPPKHRLIKRDRKESTRKVAAIDLKKMDAAQMATVMRRSPGRWPGAVSPAP